MISGEDQADGDIDHNAPDIARYQRYLIRSVAISFLSQLFLREFPGLGLIVSVPIVIFCMVYVYKLCRKLHLWPYLRVILMIVPLVNLLVLLNVTNAATRYLRARGYTIGLLGAHE